MFLQKGNLRHPWVRWGNFLSEDQIEDLAELKNSYEPFYGKVFRGTELVEEEDNRKAKIFFVNRTDSTSPEWFFKYLEECICSVNRDFFHFDLYPLDSFQYTQYFGEDKGFYNWHWDLFANGDVQQAQRKLSIVIQLSDPEDYEGGELYLNTCGNVEQVPKEKGFACFFPSWTLHQVLPVKKGFRETIVVWVTGPDWR